MDNCSEPTYEGLKQGMYRVVYPQKGGSEPTYEGLKQGPDVIQNPGAAVGSEPTYEGLKPFWTINIDYRSAIVPSLPMRD